MFKVNKKTILTLLAIALMGSGMLFAHTTHAAFLSDFFGIGAISLDALNFIASYLFYVIGFIGGLAFTFGGFLIDLALELNSGITELEMVQSGWTIVLNLTNLAFVLGIIWIAIATILRNQSYGMKQILWKLIAAAVLVNFSLVIAGFFLDAAGIVTQFFIDKASPPATVGGQVTFATQLAASLKPQGNLSITDSAAQIQKILTVGTGGEQAFANSTAQSLNIMANLVFGSVFTVIGAITFLGIAALLIVRFVSIAILLVLAPLVWLGWVFPAMKQYWDMWWGNFLKWTFFAPASSFFLYLAILTALGKHEFIDKAVQVASAKGAGDAIKQALFSTLANATQQIIVIALMFGALIAAEKSGLYGAGAFKSMAQGVNKWVGDKAKSGALFAKNRGMLLGKGAAERMAKKPLPFVPRFAQRAFVGQVAGALKQQKDSIDAKTKAQLAIPTNLRFARANWTDEDRVANARATAQDKKASGEGLTAKDRDLARKYGYEDEIIKKAGPRLNDKNREYKEDDPNGKYKRGDKIPNSSPEHFYNKLDAAEKTGDDTKINSAAEELAERMKEVMKDWSAEDFAGAGDWVSKIEDFESATGRAITQAIAQTATGDKFNKLVNEIRKGNKKLELRDNIKNKVDANENNKKSNEDNKTNISYKPLPVFRIENSLKNVLDNFGGIGSEAEGGAAKPPAPTPPPATGGKP